MAIGLPGLCIYGAGFPFFILIKLIIHHKRGDINNPLIKLNYGYFFFAFKDIFFYWEIIIIIRRFLILFIHVYFVNNIINKEFFLFALYWAF